MDTGDAERRQRVGPTLPKLGPETWRLVNFMENVDDWGLPSKRADFRAYAAR